MRLGAGIWALAFFLPVLFGCRKRKKKDGSESRTKKTARNKRTGENFEEHSSQSRDADERGGSESDAGGVHEIASVAEGDGGGRTEGRDQSGVGRRTGGDLDRGIIYSALPTQKRFHDSKARFKGFSGPIGSGKSAALCQEAIKLSYMNPGRTGLIGSPTYPMLRDSTLTALIETLHDNAVPFELNKADNVLVMKDTGSRILLRAVDEV